MDDTTRAASNPAPRTIAPSREDVLSNLAFFFGDPVVPERLRDYSEHHAMCAPASAARTRLPRPPLAAAHRPLHRAQDLPLPRRGAQTPGLKFDSTPHPPAQDSPVPLPPQYYGQNTKIRETLNNLILKVGRLPRCQQHAARRRSSSRPPPLRRPPRSGTPRSPSRLSRSSARPSNGTSECPPSTPTPPSPLVLRHRLLTTHPLLAGSASTSASCSGFHMKARRYPILRMCMSTYTQALTHIRPWGATGEYTNTFWHLASPSGLTCMSEASS